jgi:phosphoribosylamine--glycine ligase
VFLPILKALDQAGATYRGLLYAGLMLESGEPRVIEFNCRLGDPETQVVLPRLESDLLDIIEGCAAGKLSKVRPIWKDEPCVGVVMASQGYPGAYRTGMPIRGLDRVQDGAMVFHSGTALREGVPHTAGGRVLTVSALGDDIADARRRAYAAVLGIRFEGAAFRTDIALRAVQTP